MKTLGLILMYFLMGFTEWYLCSVRTWAIASRKAVKASLLALIEEALGAFVFVYVIFNRDQWWLLAFGVLGGAVGVYIGVRRSK